MPWQFCEIVKSRQTLECGFCGKPRPADENKVCIKPSKSTMKGSATTTIEAVLIALSVQ
jgi:hypothetical protein